MPLGMLELITPYFFAGFDLGGGVHDALALLHVDEYDTAFDENAVVIWGIARVDSSNPNSPFFSPKSTGGAPPPTNNVKSGDQSSWLKWEWHDIDIRFRITLARRAGEAVSIPKITDTETSKVLSALGAATGTAISDFPNTQFRLELMFEVAAVSIPRFTGAKLEGLLLVPDPDNKEVKIELPRVLFILTQDSASDTTFNADIGSFGAETLDDSDTSVGSIKMTPEFAFINKDQTIGIGLRKAVLDLSDKSTPLDVLDTFGIGGDWKGIYLEEVRVFILAKKSTGTVINVVSRDLMFGLHPTPGLWGDLSVDYNVLGANLAIGLRVYSVEGNLYTPELVTFDNVTKINNYKVALPSNAGPESENYVLFLDIDSGAAPFVVTALVGEEHTQDIDDALFSNVAHHPEDISALQRIRFFSQDQRLGVKIASSRNTDQHRIIILDVTPDPIPNRKNKADTTPPATLSPETTEVSLEKITDKQYAYFKIKPLGATLTIGGTVVPIIQQPVKVPLLPEESKSVSVKWTTSGQTELNRYTLFFSNNQSDKSGVIGAGNATQDEASASDLNALAQAWKSGLILRVDAYASFENTANAEHDKALSEQRRAYLISLIRAANGDIKETDITGASFGQDGVPPTDASDARLTAGQVPGDHSAFAESVANPENYKQEIAKYRIATASLIQTEQIPQEYTGSLKRDKVIPGSAPSLAKGKDPPVPTAQQPPWLRAIGGTVRFERDWWPIAAELRLTVDFKTAHEEGLDKFKTKLTEIRPGLEEPGEQDRLPKGEPNPEDGVVEFRVAFTYDRSNDTYTETLVAKAGEEDRDGLWSWGTIPAADATGEPQSDGWRDLLGLYFTLAPLLASSATDAASGGSIVPLLVDLGIPIVVTALGIAHVLRVTHYGVELNVKHDPDEVHASLLFDVETAIWLNLKIGSFVLVTNRPDKPIKVRYKAVGFAFNDVPNQPTSFLPIFDSSKGYTIDLSDSGSLKVLPSLGNTFGDIIHVLGARIARTNPLNIEVDLGLAVDLGVFSVDKFGFRLPIDPLGTPSITAIGIGVDIPNVLKGKGYLKIEQAGFSGQLDITLPSVGIRIAGGLGISTVTQHGRSATATFLTLTAEYPSGIPLGGTGLAIFGFLGLFAMHYKRNENPAARDPALDWLVNQVAGDPTDVRGWTPQLDQWAFGVGLVAGTMEGGTVVNIKGLLALELPGPRVVLFVKANILSEKPKTKGTATGTLLAVVDISPQRILIGIQFEYHIKQVLDLVIPVEAGFFYDPPTYPPEHFYLDVGTIAQPATAKIFGTFDGTAYFMVHGDGIPDFPLGALGGFSVAAGFRVSLIWGNTDIGLYLKIDAGFDVGIGFKPLFFAGRVFVDGELRLFIVSVEAHGDLSFHSDGSNTRIEGEICGHVDFFFFSVGGCVSFSIGDDPAAPPVPDPIRDFMLQSRSAALLEGTAVDRGVDTVLCHGTTDHSVPKTDVRINNVVQSVDVFVPIDSIPLIQFEIAPSVATNAQIDGQLNGGLPTGFGEGWQKRGQNYLNYTIHKIELNLIALHGVPVAPGTAPVSAGPKPYTWRHPAQQAGSDGLPVELALLDWKPTNVDKAMVQGPALDGLVDSRWGHVCTKIAKAARVMWTFRFAPLGPSVNGWQLKGQAWPDEAGAHRSMQVDLDIRVNEIWKTNTFIDGLLPTKPATVDGILAPCPKPTVTPVDTHIALADSAFQAATSPTHATSSLMAPDHDFARGTPQRMIILNNCIAKVLEAPYEVLADAFIFPNPLLAQAFKKLDEQRKSQLRDVIRITGGPFEKEVVLLIFARIKMTETGLVKVNTYGKEGKLLTGTTTTFKMISTDNQLPLQWMDQTGPWWDDVKLARTFFASLSKQGDWAQYLVTIKLDQPAFKFEIGIFPLQNAIQRFGMRTPASWFLAVIDALSEKEINREEDDNGEAGDDQQGLQGGLLNLPHALLLPGGQYEVSVTYDGKIGKKREDPDEDQDSDEIVEQGAGVTNKVSTRTFYTDSEPPRSLDPWMLAQYPAPGELYHFYEDPVVVVFATNDVLELYGAYSKKLRAVAKAASFRGSENTPEAVNTRFMLAEFFTPIEGAIISPWQATVRRRLGALTCGQFNPDGNQHGRTVLPFLLDPLTDYVLDMEMLTAAGVLSPPPPLPGEAGSRPLYRQNFTTSQYASREAFSKDIFSALINGKTLVHPASLLALSGTVSDDAFDQALHNADLEIAHRPKVPAITVFWSTGVPAQPIAVYIETSEPIWRTRKEPTAHYDAANVYIQSWTLDDKLWLYPDELIRVNLSIPVVKGGDFVKKGNGRKTEIAITLAQFRKKYLGPKPVEPLPLPLPPPLHSHSFVSRFVHDTSGTRTLVILKPNSRGNKVSLGLARNLNPFLDTAISDTPLTMLEIELKSAPWENVI